MARVRKLDDAAVGLCMRCAPELIWSGSGSAGRFGSCALARLMESKLPAKDDLSTLAKPQHAMGKSDFKTGKAVASSLVCGAVLVR